MAELKNEIAALQRARAALQATSSTAAPKTASTTTDAKPRRRRIATPASTAPTGGRANANANGNSTGARGGDAGSAATAAARLDPANAASAPTPPRIRRRPAKSEKRVEVLLADQLETMLQETPDGLSAITISKRANAGYNQVRDLLRELEASGQVRRTGSRRTSLWRLITEEEHIAERAAELERLSLAKSGDLPGG